MPKRKGYDVLTSRTMPPAPRTTARGRPVVTTHAAIERAAFDLFAQHGFEGTTMDAIAREVGVGKRTIFRYYPSKNDIPWGQFGRTLEGFRAMLDALPEDLPVHEAVHRGVLEFNRFPEDAYPSHRDRMGLILSTPELEAHSVLQYAAWRRVIAAYVARRTGTHATDLVPRLAGHVSLSLALTSYETWLDTDGDGDALLAILGHAMGELHRYLDS